MIEVPQNKTKKVDRNKEGDWRKFILHRAVLKVFSSKLRQQEDNRLRKKIEQMMARSVERRPN